MTMDAQTLGLVSAVLTIFQKIGEGPIVISIVAIFLGPWACMAVIAIQQSKRFDAMKAMYESNVKLVEDYEGLARDQRDIITLNTAKWSEATESIRANQYCPAVRTEKKRVEVGINEH